MNNLYSAVVVTSGGPVSHDKRAVPGDMMGGMEGSMKKPMGDSMMKQASNGGSMVKSSMGSNSNSNSMSKSSMSKSSSGSNSSMNKVLIAPAPVPAKKEVEPAEPAGGPGNKMSVFFSRCVT